MRVLVGIDDTDNLESRGTGFRARELGLSLVRDGMAKLAGISRHQLYVHPDIPYTSHNSALCLDIAWLADDLGDLVPYCRHYLEHASAPGSDAAFCIAPYDEVEDEVVSYGRSAKDTVLNKAIARDVAGRAGFHLEGVTGDHGGMIGALACVGLRKSGNDGRFVWVKGVRDLDGVTTVAHLLGETGIDRLDASGESTFKATDRVDVSPWPRPVLLNDQAVLLIEKAEEPHADYEWKLVPRERTKQY